MDETVHGYRYDTSFSQVAFSPVTLQDTEDVKTLVANTTIRSSYNYCVVGTLTCRNLVLLSDKTSAAPVADFYDVFLSAERAVVRPDTY